MWLCSACNILIAPLRHPLCSRNLTHGWSTYPRISALPTPKNRRSTTPSLVVLEISSARYLLNIVCAASGPEACLGFSCNHGLDHRVSVLVISLAITLVPTLSSVIPLHVFRSALSPLRFHKGTTSPTFHSSGHSAASKLSPQFVAHSHALKITLCTAF